MMGQAVHQENKQTIRSAQDLGKVLARFYGESDDSQDLQRLVNGRVNLFIREGKSVIAETQKDGGILFRLQGELICEIERNPSTNSGFSARSVPTVAEAKRSTMDLGLKAARSREELRGQVEEDRKNKK